MSMHRWFGTHVADLKQSHWEAGLFVSHCTRCGEAMIKPPGQAWLLRSAAPTKP